MKDRKNKMKRWDREIDKKRELEGTGREN